MSVSFTFDPTQQESWRIAFWSAVNAAFAPGKCARGLRRYDAASGKIGIHWGIHPVDPERFQQVARDWADLRNSQNPDRLVQPSQYTGFPADPVVGYRVLVCEFDVGSHAEQIESLARVERTIGLASAVWHSGVAGVTADQLVNGCMGLGADRPDRAPSAGDALQVQTGKSVQAVWLLDETLGYEDFRWLQERLQYMAGSDPTYSQRAKTIREPGRIMVRRGSSKDSMRTVIVRATPFLREPMLVPHSVMAVREALAEVRLPERESAKRTILDLGDVAESTPSERYEAALRVLALREAAVAGNAGHAHTLKTFVFLAKSFALDPEDQVRAVEESGWNARCQPPWSHAELVARVCREVGSPAEFDAYQAQKRAEWLAAHGVPSDDLVDLGGWELDQGEGEAVVADVATAVPGAVTVTVAPATSAAGAESHDAKALVKEAARLARAAAEKERERKRRERKEQQAQNAAKAAESGWPNTQVSRGGEVVPHPSDPRNALHFLKNVMGVTVVHCLMSQTVRWEVPGWSPSVEAERAAQALSHLREKAWEIGFEVSQDSLRDAGLRLKAARHPVAEWLGGLPAWDGVDRLPDLMRTLDLRPLTGEPLTAQQRALVEVLVRKWLRSAVMGAMVGADATLGVGAEGILVLSGPQGVGKTRWFRWIAGGDFFGEGLSVNPDDKDSVMKATRRWVGEMGELDGTFRKADIARLKSFTTDRVDSYRPPFGREVEDVPRRTVFCGTCNHDQMLQDETGNRRWWVIPVEATHPGSEALREAVWAQALAEVRAGGHCWLDRAEKLALEEWQRPSLAQTDTDEIASVALVPSGDAHTCMELLGMLNAKRNWTKADRDRLAATLRKRGERNVNRGGVTRWYVEVDRSKVAGVGFDGAAEMGALLGKELELPS